MQASLSHFSVSFFSAHGAAVGCTILLRHRPGAILPFTGGYRVECLIECRPKRHKTCEGSVYHTRLCGGKVSGPKPSNNQYAPVAYKQPKGTNAFRVVLVS